VEADKIAPLILQIPLPVFIYQDEIFKFVNGRMAEITGYGVQELIGKNPFDLVHHEDRETMQERSRERLRSGGTVDNYEFKIMNRSGEIRFLHGYFSVVEFGGRPAILGQLLDVTGQKKLLQALQESEARYRDLFENVNDVVYIHDLEGNFLAVNPAVSRIDGVPPEELIGKSIGEFLSPKARHLLKDYLEEILTRGVSRGPMRVRTKSGEDRFLEYHSVLFKGEKPYVRGISRDITEQVLARREAKQYIARLEEANRELQRLNRELQETKRELERQARLDLLTGVGNRRFFQERLTEELNRAARTRTPLTILIIDITNFKMINDTLGHLAGDEALKRVAARLQASLRSYDSVFRIGGDEFAVILPQTGEEEALEVAERIRRSICGEGIAGEGVKLPVCLSVGFASLSGGRLPGNVDRLIKEADDRMYAEKRRQKLALL
jgi:diguanylate cyclase (GGDEF)-like protein/PAS domain S-box-containing protein